MWPARSKGAFRRETAIWFRALFRETKKRVKQDLSRRGGVYGARSCDVMGVVGIVRHRESNEFCSDMNRSFSLAHHVREGKCDVSVLNVWSRAAVCIAVFG